MLSQQVLVAIDLIIYRKSSVEFSLKISSSAIAFVNRITLRHAVLVGVAPQNDRVLENRIHVVIMIALVRRTASILRLAGERVVVIIALPYLKKAVHAALIAQLYHRLIQLHR